MAMARGPGCARLPKGWLGDQPASARGATAHALDDPTELSQVSNRDGSSITIHIVLCISIISISRYVSARYIEFTRTEYRVILGNTE